MTSPLDYNQHLLAYVQAWRQLLDASAAMSSGLPLPPGMPPAPPMMPAPPMPPAPPMMPPPATSPTAASPPTDYAQQLFGYLQTWRRYLEQAVGAASGTIQPMGPQPTGATGSPSTGATGSPTTGATGSQSSGAQSSFGSQSKPPIVKPPKDPYGTIGFGHMPWKGFDDIFSGSENEGFARAGSAFSAKAASVTPSQATQPTTQSLFYGRAADTPPVTTGMPAGVDPRRAAPPATSRWWAAGQGLRPGFKDKPDTTNLLNIRPRDLRGGEQ